MGEVCKKEGEFSFGIHTFKFIDKDGKTTLVKWRFAPEDGEKQLTADELKSKPADFLQQALIDRAKQGPVKWDMWVTIGQPGDPETDPTVLWPKDRKEFKAGTLTLTAATPQDGAECKGINYDPYDYYPISWEELYQCGKDQGIDIRPAAQGGDIKIGDMLFVRSGWKEAYDSLQHLWRIACMRQDVEIQKERTNVLKMKEELRMERLAKLQRDFRISTFQTKEMELEDRIYAIQEEVEDARWLASEEARKRMALKANLQQCLDDLQSAKDEQTTMEVCGTIK